MKTSRLTTPLINIESKKEQKQLQRIVHKLSIKNLDAWFGTKQALKNINLDVKEKTFTAFIGAVVKQPLDA